MTDDLIPGWLRAQLDEKERRVAAVKCWQCGVAPSGLAEVTALDDPDPSYIPTGWPPGDHEHAVRPPTPAELAAAGHRALERVRALA